MPGPKVAGLLKVYKDESLSEARLSRVLLAVSVALSIIRFDIIGFCTAFTTRFYWGEEHSGRVSCTMQQERHPQVPQL